MIKIEIKFLIILLICGHSNYVFACLGRIGPGDTEKNDYVIFVGEVTGVRLIQYENFILPPLYRDNVETHLDGYPLDSTPRHIVYVVPDTHYRGTLNHIYELEIYGCGIEIPALHQRGIFFISKEQVIPIYESRGGDFEEWLLKLNKLYKPTDIELLQDIRESRKH